MCYEIETFVIFIRLYFFWKSVLIDERWEFALDLARLYETLIVDNISL